MRITVETVLEQCHARAFLALYREAMAPLETLAAARQSLTDDEFLAEARDPSVLKFVGWDPAGAPCALSLVATDLTVVPWISAPYFEARFPEQYARRAVYYYGALVVRPDHKASTAAFALLREMVRMIKHTRGVAAFDCCAFTANDIKLPEMIGRLAARHGHFDRDEVDVQRYFAYWWTGDFEEEREPELAPANAAVVDLVAAERAERAAVGRGVDAGRARAATGGT